MEKFHAWIFTFSDTYMIFARLDVDNIKKVKDFYLRK